MRRDELIRLIESSVPPGCEVKIENWSMHGVFHDNRVVVREHVVETEHGAYKYWNLEGAGGSS